MTWGGYRLAHILQDDLKGRWRVVTLSAVAGPMHSSAKQISNSKELCLTWLGTLDVNPRQNAAQPLS